MSTTASRRRSPGKSLPERVRWLVEGFAQGSSRAAAELWDVQRLTLLRLMKGQVRSPRGNVLERIAVACGTTTEWLRTGEGPPPELPDPKKPLSTPWRVRWEKLVEDLGLSEGTAARLIAMPLQIHRVFDALVLEGHPLGVSILGMDALRRAEEFECRAWVALLTGLAEAFGRDRLRQKIESERLLLDLQFNPVAIWRYDQDGVSRRSENASIVQSWTETLKFAHEIFPKLPPHAPSLAVLREQA